jgi:hypothetical protein
MYALHTLKALKAILTCFLLALVLPATNCCLLDGIGFPERADCCPASESRQPICDDNCSVAVSIPQNERAVSIVPEFVLTTVATEIRLQTVNVSCQTFPRTDEEALCEQWHFRERAALPVRAPSFPS